MKYKSVIIIVLISAITSFARTEPDTLKVTGLKDLIEYAVTRNSKIEPIEYQRKIEIIKKEQVNKQPMPMFEAMVDYIPLDFMNKPEYMAFYSQKLLLPGKLRTFELISEVKAGKQDIIKNQLKIELTRQVKSNYYSLYYYEKLLEYNSEYRAIIGDIIKSLELSYASGMGTQSRILKMNNELQMLEYENTEIESMRKVYINNLRILTGLNIPDSLQTNDMLTVLNTDYELDSIKLAETMVKNNPEFKMIDNMAESSRVERKIAEADKIPDITLRGGFKYMAKEPMSFLSFGIGIDLPFMPWNTKRINAMVNESKVMELQAESMRNSSLLYMKNELQSMLIMINSIKEKISYLNEVLIPQTEQTFNSTLVSYSSGSDEFMNLLDAYRSMREIYQMRVKEETGLLKQYSELEFLLGKDLLKK
jgi:outer membrane protein TolC